MSAPAASLPPIGLRHIPPLTAALAATLALGLAILSWRLWPDWRTNPDLSHGLFMPAVFLLLLHDARASGTRRFLAVGPVATTALALLLLGGLLALFGAGLYAAALGWSHTVVDFSLVAALVILLAAGLVAFADQRVRLIPLNWNALVALALWLLCAPIPPGTYSRLTLSLQLWVSENVLTALHLLGVAALRHGNIIELAHGRVGIEEACSGVRSLISCVFAGLFFSATLVRGPWARALLIGLAAPLAIVMNFARSLTLTLLANAGVDISGTWHDATGFAVLGITAVLLAGLALLLERREKKSPAPAAAPSDSPLSALSTQPTAAVSPSPSSVSRLSALNAQLSLLATGLALAASLSVFFVLNTRSSTRTGTAVPNLYALLPVAAPGWQVETTPDLYQFQDVLQTEHLAQRTYLRASPTGPIQVTLYAAYWRPGQASVSLVASHTPDACWPGSGWTMEPLSPATPPPPRTIAGRPLPAPEYRFFKSTNFPQHVWFWHLFDGRPIAYRDPYSATELLRIAWRYGFRRDGDQLFVRVSANVPWDQIVDEPFLAQFFARTQPLGL